MDKVVLLPILELKQQLIQIKLVFQQQNQMEYLKQDTIQ